jgi:hypothetical protein
VHSAVDSAFRVVDPVETAAQKEEFARVDLAQADRFAIAFEQDAVRIWPTSGGFPSRPA